MLRVRRDPLLMRHVDWRPSDVMQYCSGSLFRTLDEKAEAKIDILRMGEVGMLVGRKWAGRKQKQRVLCPYRNVITAFVMGDRYIA